MTVAGADAVRELVARAEAHAARREFGPAIAAFEAALEACPADAALHVQLSYVHSLAGHYRCARAHALRALAAGTLPAGAAAELLPRLRTFNALPQMLACVDRLGPATRMPIPLLLTVGAQLSYAGLHARALAYLDEAFRGDPDYPPTLVARGQVLMYLGRFEDARRDVERVLRRAPGIAQAHWLRAMLETAPTAAAIDAVRAGLRQPSRRPEDVALLGFALHRQLDAAGDHAGAWEALMLACGAKRATLRYERADTEALFAALQRWRPAATVAATVTADAASAATPVFIVGMHRSGTTLLEQLLDGHPQVRGLGELYDFTGAMRGATDHHCRGVVDATIVARAAAADLAAAGRAYLDGVAWRLQGEAFFTDKLPSNFLNLGFIAHALPQARILHMVREPVETCFSNLRELFSDANPYSYDMGELAAYHRGYRRLMAHWHACFPGRILDVDYARLTREPEAVLREVAAFCGFGFDPAMLEHRARGRGVATASAVQVRGGIQPRDQPKWAPYRRVLQPLIDALAG